MTYAFSLFNGVMLLGQNAAGLERGVQGQRDVLLDPRPAATAVASYGLVEDMEYSWTLRIAGEKIVFQPDVVGLRGDARLGRARPRRISAGAGSSAGARSGRSTWARCCSSQPARLVGKSRLGLRIDHPLDGVARVHLCRRSLAFDAIACFALAGSNHPSCAACLLGCCGVFMTASLAASMRFRRSWRCGCPWRYLSSIVLFPVYVGWKFCDLAWAAGPSSGFAPTRARPRS